MFATPEHGLMLQGHQPLAGQDLRGLLGSAAPELLLHCRQLVSPEGAAPFTSHVTRAPMQGYAGLDVSVLACAPSCGGKGVLIGAAAGHA